MSMIVDNFFEEVFQIHKNGSVTEHSYRPALTTLLNLLSNEITAINEPKRTDCGAPDFIFLRNQIPIGHLEAKDIGIDLNKMSDANREQQDRYCKALPNLIYTNCLDWNFYRNGELFTSVSIANYVPGARLKPDKEQFNVLENFLRDFIAQRPQTITSPMVLAKMMANKAALIKDVLHKILIADVKEETDLSGQYKTFRQNLIHDLSKADFADIYAETITYGMFAARLHDTTPDTFSRQEAQKLIPRTNPFLRNLFSYISNADLDDPIVWVFDDLASVFQAANMPEIMKGFGKLTGKSDPFLHFYETFLTAYNPEKREKCGVWYTPEAVVNFIVRAVDDVLQTEFKLPMGLADTSKTTVNWDGSEKEIHRVQILDPATGTGTFLAEVIKQIAPKIKNIAPGMWSSYLENELIPRLHGFELLMASYAMCHTKLDMILNELGYIPSDTPPRLSVYLTNSLEEGDREVRDLFMTGWLSREAQEANIIKQQMPIMCVLGNPPYSGESKNKGKWIMGLMEDYKKEPGTQQKLKERNPKWINDDYVKFIRMSEYLISSNGEGVLGFITNHAYLDNPTFRGMRWHLMHSFDKIYILDLHGNSKKKEVTPDGEADENVFDIQQGVAILIAIKHRQSGNNNSGALSQTPAQIFHGDLWGTREQKYEKLFESSLANLDWQQLNPQVPHYAFIRHKTELQEQYYQGFAIHEFMPINSVGIVTSRDTLTIDTDKERRWERVKDFAQLDTEAARLRYNLAKDVRDWQVAWAQDDVRNNLSKDKLIPIAYRPFDTRWTLYTGKSRGFMCYPRNDVMRHMIRGNLAFLIGRQGQVVGSMEWSLCFITDTVNDLNIFYRGGELVFPVYLYPNNQEEYQKTKINFAPTLHQKLLELAKHPEHDEPNELAIFDYIYGVLHCPAYRSTYAGFLKYDFPRIPWPQTPEEFWDVSAKGSQLRKLHLMEPDAIGETPYPYMGEGDNKVEAPKLKNNQIWVNKTQYFDQVPDGVWDFHIGGYKPAQKWLKDRRKCELLMQDIFHYQRILKVLHGTAKIMPTIHLLSIPEKT